MKIKLLSLIAIVMATIGLNAQQSVISGKVLSNGEGVPFANIMIEGTNIGVSTDANGNYQLNDLPVGHYTIHAHALGYQHVSNDIDVQGGSNTNINFELNKDVLQLSQVVVSASRNETNRREAPVIVNTMSAQQLSTVQASTMSEGLNFVPGLRTENNCQNCGFTQLRMNGMEGAYSQILINGRPIFSGLAGVYGLEILPSGMIERLEVIKGGGSALYGSNAIAGTVNVITKEPLTNSYEIKLTDQIVGVGFKGLTPTNDKTLNFNATLVGNNARNGIALYGFIRDRGGFDANGDSFTELPQMNNLTIGGSFYQRLGLKGKLSFDVYAINSSRRGGNKFHVPVHEADIAEALNHEIYSGAITFERFMRETDKFSTYFSGQYVNRDAYYGAEQALDAYGNSVDMTWVGGVQYDAHIEKLNLTIGAENVNGNLNDKKLSYREWDEATGQVVTYPNSVVANQMTNTSGAYAQAAYKFGAIKASAGARFDHYIINDLHDSETGAASGDVFSPRLNLLYNLHEHTQIRASYSQGYRAPQVFDEDLHIEASGSRRIIHQNSADLKQETSQSTTLSVDVHPHFGKNTIQLTAAGFYTKLKDPFVNEFGTPDTEGQVIYTRVNAEGFAEVYGINLELNWFYSDVLNVSSGFTIQRSEYSEAQEFDKKRFFRTPDNYGYLTAQIIPADRWRITLTENYTGSMLIPYFGSDLTNPDEGELRTSEQFFDTGLKVNYEISRKNLNIDFFTGVKNIFNSYQSQFDTGIDRDPAYVYGPLLPRTVYFGVKLGQFK